MREYCFAAWLIFMVVCYAASGYLLWKTNALMECMERHATSCPEGEL